MTIADNLEALANQKLGYQDSVEACKTSLINKDVAVPVGAKLADIAGLIDEVPSDKSWENYIAVRNRTKTTIEAGDIDPSMLNGTNAGYSLFTGMRMTKAILNFENMASTGGLIYCFAECPLLTELQLNILKYDSTFTGIFTATNNIAKLVINGIKDSAIYNSTSANNNIFVQTQLATSLTTLNFTVDILPNLYLAVLVNLNIASVVQVLGQLYNYSAGVAHTITFNRSFTGLSLSDYNLINNAKIEANARNWTVAGLTYSM